MRIFPNSVYNVALSLLTFVRNILCIVSIILHRLKMFTSSSFPHISL